MTPTESNKALIELDDEKFNVGAILQLLQAEHDHTYGGSERTFIALVMRYVEKSRAALAQQVPREPTQVCIERIEGYERTSAQPAPHARPDDWNAALEEAAKVCEEHAQRALAAGSLIDPITLARESAAEGCADEIRALKRECEGEVKIGKEADDDFYL